MLAHPDRSAVRRALAALALLALAVQAPAQKGLRTYTGKACRVKSNAPEAVAKLVAGRIDRFCGVFQGFYDELALEKRRDNEVVARLFATYDEFLEFMKRDVGDKPWSAYASQSLNAIVLYSDESDTTLKHTLFHECSHQYLARYTSAAPKWFNEGLAAYFEGWRIDDGADYAVRPALYHLISLQTALKSGQYLPLAELTALDPAKFVDFAKEYPKLHPTLHYATSWGLLYYLLELAPAEQRELARQYFRDLNQKGAKADQARIAIEDWKAFEGPWKAAILALEPKCESAADHITVAGSYRYDGQYASAIISYQDALELDPAAKGIRYWLGFCHKKIADYDGARPLLAEALAEDKTDPRPAYQLARIESGMDKKDAKPDMEKALGHARDALQRAGDDNPFYVCFLARCQSRAGDHKNAVANARKALKLADEEQKASYEAAVAELEAAAKKK
jgi:hypothetical protein